MRTNSENYNMVDRSKEKLEKISNNFVTFSGIMKIIYIGLLLLLVLSFRNAFAITPNTLQQENTVAEKTILGIENNQYFVVTRFKLFNAHSIEIKTYVSSIDHNTLSQTRSLHIDSVRKIEFAYNTFYHYTLPDNNKNIYNIFLEENYYRLPKPHDSSLQTFFISPDSSYNNENYPQATRPKQKESFLKTKMFLILIVILNFLYFIILNTIFNSSKLGIENVKFDISKRYYEDQDKILGLKSTIERLNRELDQTSSGLLKQTTKNDELKTANEQLKKQLIEFDSLSKNFNELMASSHTINNKYNQIQEIFNHKKTLLNVLFIYLNEVYLFYENKQEYNTNLKKGNLNSMLEDIEIDNLILTPELIDALLKNNIKSFYDLHQTDFEEIEALFGQTYNTQNLRHDKNIYIRIIFRTKNVLSLLYSIFDPMFTYSSSITQSSMNHSFEQNYLQDQAKIDEDIKNILTPYNKSIENTPSDPPLLIRKRKYVFFNGKKINENLLDLKVPELELSIRVKNSLVSNGIRKLIDLLHYSQKDLLSFRNFGLRSLKELNQYLMTLKIKLPYKK